MRLHSQDLRNKDLVGVPDFIPMGLLNEEQAQINHGQTLNRLNGRGGLGVLEILANIHKKRLTHMVTTQSDVDELNDLVKEYHNT